MDNQAFESRLEDLFQAPDPEWDSTPLVDVAMERIEQQDRVRATVLGAAWCIAGVILVAAVTLSGAWTYVANELAVLDGLQIPTISQISPLAALIALAVLATFSVERTVRAF